MTNQERLGTQERRLAHSLPGTNQAGTGPDAHEDHDADGGAGHPTRPRTADGDGTPAATRGFVADIEGVTVANDDFRRILYTARHCQLVVMALSPGEEIGAEIHMLDQLFRVEAGTGEAIVGGETTAIRAGFVVVVPAGATHNIVNTGSVPLRLFTVYAPPNHRDGVVHHTRADADADHEQFDGTTTERVTTDAHSPPPGPEPAESETTAS